MAESDNLFYHKPDTSKSPNKTRAIRPEDVEILLEGIDMPDRLKILFDFAKSASPDCPLMISGLLNSYGTRSNLYDAISRMNRITALRGVAFKRTLAGYLFVEVPKREDTRPKSISPSQATEKPRKKKNVYKPRGKKSPLDSRQPVQRGLIVVSRIATQPPIVVDRKAIPDDEPKAHNIKDSSPFPSQIYFSEREKRLRGIVNSLPPTDKKALETILNRWFGNPIPQSEWILAINSVRGDKKFDSTAIGGILAMLKQEYGLTVIETVINGRPYYYRRPL